MRKRQDRTKEMRRRGMWEQKGMIHKDGEVGCGLGNREVAVKVVPVRLPLHALLFPSFFSGSYLT